MASLLDFKIIIIGNCNTGKTKFMYKWTRDIFSDAYKSTIVSEFGFKIIEKNGKHYRIQVWDLTGNDPNHQIVKIFVKHAHGCIIMSDSIKKQTREE